MNPRSLFTFNPAEDESVDPEYVLKDYPNITVQVCAWGGTTDYSVNEHGYEEPEAEQGFFLQSHGVFSSLERAMTHAITIAAMRKESA